MKQKILDFRALSPIAIRSDHAASGSSSIGYIPGTTLAGSLAAAHRMLRAEREDEFAELFLREQVCFSALYPAEFQKSDTDISTSYLPVLPLPKTAQSCKRFTGFHRVPGEGIESKSTARERHGVRDSLLDWGIFSLLDRENASLECLFEAMKPLECCAHCQYPLEPISGYYRAARGKPEQRMQASLDTRLQTRTGINRDWGVVEEGILYNREVFKEGTHFWGKLQYPDQLEATLIEFLEEANKEGILCIGNGRTRGLGRFEYKLIGSTRPQISTFQQRLQTFDTACKGQARQAEIKEQIPFCFALTLYAPAILRDASGRYRTGLDGATLGELLAYPRDTFKRIYQATSSRRITGWNEIWGTPRSSDYALETGSVFLFASAQELDDHLLQALYALEGTGIGQRRAEGFGRLGVSDPFHLQGVQA